MTNELNDKGDALVIVERIGHVTVMTLNRPKALNSMNAELATALGNCLQELEADIDQRVGIITGAGKAFCAGMDLKAFASGESVEPVGHPEWGFGGVVSHFINKPLIAAVNGYAFGGGAEIALACDLVIADETSAWGFPEVTRGLFAGAGGLTRLAQQIPQRLALELVLTGQSISAATAAEYHLVNKLAPQGDALKVAIELAQTIAKNAPLAVQASKRLLHNTRHSDPWAPGTWEATAAEMDGVFKSNDAIEGATAFAEKRDPTWTGR